LPACSSTLHALVPLLHLRPDLVQGPLRGAAIEDVDMLVRDGVGLINGADLRDVSETRLEVLLPSSHDDYTFASVATRSPKEVALMPADGGGETVFLIKPVDGARVVRTLAVDR